VGHYCRICARVRPNERFTGRGHRTHLCRDCQRLPRAERERIEQSEEIYGFLEQSNISGKNIRRLEVLCRAADSKVRELASVVLDIARIRPGKRRRWKFLAARRRDLFMRLKIALGEEWIDPIEDDLLDEPLNLLSQCELNPDLLSEPGVESDDEIPF
jgi:hypothetical protein